MKITFNIDYDEMFLCSDCFKGYLQPISELREGIISTKCNVCGREENHEYHVEYWTHELIKEGVEQ